MPALGSIALALCLPSSVALVAYPMYALERRARSWVIALVILALTPIPLVVPAEERLARAIVAVVVIFISAKMFDLHQQRTPRPPFAAYAAFILHPFTAVLRRLPDEPSYSRGENLRRLGRGVFFGTVGTLAAAWFYGRRAELPGIVVTQTVMLLTFYVGLEGVLVATVSVVRLGGMKARDILDQPYLAVTPADFWRRYNRIIGQFLHEDVFRRTGGFRAPIRATLITFVVSAIAHEYLFSIALGRVEGWQTAFFLIQGLGVAATVRLRPEGAWIAVSTACTLAFNIATSFLFYMSVNQVYPWW